MKKDSYDYCVVCLLHDGFNLKNMSAYNLNHKSFFTNFVRVISRKLKWHNRLEEHRISHPRSVTWAN